MDTHQTFTAIVRAVSGVARLDTAERAAIDKVRQILAESGNEAQTEGKRKRRGGYDRQEKGGEDRSEE